MSESEKEFIKEAIKNCIKMEMKEVKRHNTKMWRWVFGIAISVVLTMFSVGVVQLRVSTKNSVLIDRMVSDEHVSVPYDVWFTHNNVTTLELRALSTFIKGDVEEFIEVMDQFEELKMEITKEYRANQRKRYNYRGIFKNKEE